MDFQQVVQLLGVTKDETRQIVENILKQNNAKIGLLFLDVSYLYNFHLDDFEIVKKHNKLGRYDINAVLDWHKCLERWNNDQTVALGGEIFKPIKLVRTLDRVVNEGLEDIANAIVGNAPGSENVASFPWRAIGEGTADEPTPGDKVMGDEIDRINVNDNPDGGSLSRDGTTIYSIGNHARTLPTATVTECGMFSADGPPDKMFDHTFFASSISHILNQDAVGSTTVIYMCSA